MGMESFSIIALPYQVNIVKEEEYWYLKGSSEILSKEFESQLKSIGAIKYNSNDDEWILDDCIEMKEYKYNDFFQGLEIKGCLSYLRQGAELCYELLKKLDDKIVPLKVFILHEKVEFKDSEELYFHLNEKYNDKIRIFQKQYNSIELKVTCGNFYKEIEKRKKWYYKIFHKKI